MDRLRDAMTHAKIDHFTLDDTHATHRDRKPMTPTSNTLKHRKPAHIASMPQIKPGMRPVPCKKNPPQTPSPHQAVMN